MAHRWITGDDELGRSIEFRRELQVRGERYCLSVPSNTLIRDLTQAPPVCQGNGRPAKPTHLRADAWLKAQPMSRWKRIDVRDGSKGPLLVEAICCPVISCKRGRYEDLPEVLIVVRSHERDRSAVKTDYYLSNATPTTSLEEFCRATHAAHRVEECFQRAKGQAELADYEVRRWRGWQHHQTLSLLACWFLTLQTKQAEKKTPAITINQVRLGIASILRNQWQCDTSTSSPGDLNKDYYKINWLDFITRNDVTTCHPHACSEDESRTVELVNKLAEMRMTAATEIAQQGD